jgi:hypothetical protein
LGVAPIKIPSVSSSDEVEINDEEEEINDEEEEEDEEEEDNDDDLLDSILKEEEEEEEIIARWVEADQARWTSNLGKYLVQKRKAHLEPPPDYPRPPIDPNNRVLQNRYYIARHQWMNDFEWWWATNIEPPQ